MLIECFTHTSSSKQFTQVPPTCLYRLSKASVVMVYPTWKTGIARLASMFFVTAVCMPVNGTLPDAAGAALAAAGAGAARATAATAAGGAGALPAAASTSAATIRPAGPDPATVAKSTWPTHDTAGMSGWRVRVCVRT